MLPPEVFFLPRSPIIAQLWVNWILVLQPMRETFMPTSRKTWLLRSIFTRFDPDIYVSLVYTGYMSVLVSPRPKNSTNKLCHQNRPISPPRCFWRPRFPLSPDRIRLLNFVQGKNKDTEHVATVKAKYKGNLPNLKLYPPPPPWFLDSSFEPGSTVQDR